MVAIKIPDGKGGWIKLPTAKGDPGKDAEVTKESVEEALGYKVNSDVPEDAKFTDTIVDVSNKVSIDDKGIADGVASLDANAKIPLSQLPDTARQQTYVLTTEAEKDNLKDLITGERAYVTESGYGYIWDGSTWQTSAKSDWEDVNLHWTNIEGVPEKFAPEQHTHTVDEVEGLDAELAKKADISYVDERISSSGGSEGGGGGRGPAGSVYQEEEPDSNTVLWIDPSEDYPVFNAVSKEEAEHIVVNKAKDADTVSGYTVARDVPADADFRNTTYDLSSYVKKDGDVLGSYSERVVETSGIIDLSKGSVFVDTPVRDREYEIGGVVKSGAQSFTLQINIGEERTLRFPDSVLWQDGELPDMSEPNKTYILTFMTTNGGETWFGLFGGAFSASE